MALELSSSTSDIEHVIAELRSEFIEDAIEHIEGSFKLLDEAEKNTSKLDENLLRIKRHVHSLKGQGASFGFLSISSIMHNLEDYFETVYEVNADNLQQIRPYLNATMKILENREDPSEDDLRKIVSGLRATDQSIGEGQELKDIPALLVMGTGVQRSLVGKELVSCGFRVVTSDDPVEAISVALGAKPKFAIINKQLSSVTGVELAHVFKALEVLKGCKLILLTSDDDVEAIGKAVPVGTVVIHKDSNFYERLTDQLIDWGLFGEFT